MDLSIILVNWNTKSITLQCLASIFEQTKLKKFEVILVDNGSTDGSVEEIRMKFPQVKLIENHENLGFAKANNIGIRQAEGNYILLLNTDTIILGHALDKLIEYLKTNPKVGIAAAKLLNPDLTLQHSCAQLPTVQTVFDEYFRRKLTGWYPPEKHATTFEIESAIGACLMFSHEVLDKVGLLDERFYMNCEDIDFCRRVRQAGYKIMFVADAEIIHLGGASMKRVRWRMDKELIKTRIQYFWKHHKGLTAIAATALLVGGGIVKHVVTPALRPAYKRLKRAVI